jgi:uncharacterized membrane protein
MAETNPNARLEAFCDGVFAIALTLFIIDIKTPSAERIDTTNDLWLALKHILPSIFAFALSFTIILLTWVNHHGTLKMLNKSSAAFFFANGFLLLTIIFIPFPTALLGEYLLTDHSSPAVILYVSTMAFQAIGWILLTGAVLKYQLVKDENSTKTIRENKKYGYFAFIIYSLCAIIAFWFPLAIASLLPPVYGFFG